MLVPDWSAREIHAKRSIRLLRPFCHRPYILRICPTEEEDFNSDRNN